MIVRSTLSQPISEYAEPMTILTLALLARAPAAEPITLAQALGEAINRNADVRTAQATVESAGADIDTARGAFDPSLSISTSAERSQSRSFLAGYPTASTAAAWAADTSVSGTLATGTTWSASAEIARQAASTESSLGGVISELDTTAWVSSLGVSVEQDLLTLLRPTAARRALERAAERADQQAVAELEARQSALAATAEAWWSWQAAEDRVALDERAVETARSLERVTRAWVDEGEAEPVELARVQAERLSAEQALARARAMAATAADTLLTGIGRDPGGAVVPAGTGAPQTPPSGAVDEHLAEARTHNPTLTRLRLAVDAAKAAAREDRFAGLPALAFTGSAGVATLDTTASGAVLDLGNGEAMPTWAVGVRAEVPLGGHTARAVQARASADVRTAEIALEAEARAVDAGLRAALRDVDTAATARALAARRLEVAQQTEEGERARMAAGLRRTDQLLEAVATREEAERAVLDAQLDEWRATLQVARLEGAVDAALAQ